MSHPTESRPHWVYRCYDTAGRLLYIGCTNNVRTRIGQLRNGGHFKGESRDVIRSLARVTTEEFATYRAALDAEAAAIRAEAPLLNVIHQRDRSPRPILVEPHRSEDVA